MCPTQRWPPPPSSGRARAGGAEGVSVSLASSSRLRIWSLRGRGAGSPRPSTVSRAGSTACVGDAAVATGPSARARSTSTSRRTPRAAYDSATARRSSRAKRTSSGRVELLSTEPHALGRREPLRVDAARRDTSSTSTSRLADEACAGSTATNPCHRRDVLLKRAFTMVWKVEYSGRE